MHKINGAKPPSPSHLLESRVQRVQTSKDSTRWSHSLKSPPPTTHMQMQQQSPPLCRYFRSPVSPSPPWPHPRPCRPRAHCQLMALAIAPLQTIPRLPKRNRSVSFPLRNAVK
ncbi:unnamed protein product [Periconia digitata]|uniref:Uncharacterized protein n=1 Tax=Periconia digitata TaxID=1303443 RepID=A0A9W4UUP5_9PLEO|nr:unnamed protein product [Periconia digitata]